MTADAGSATEDGARRGGVLFAQGFHSGCHRVSGRPRQHLALPLRRLRELAAGRSSCPTSWP